MPESLRRISAVLQLPEERLDHLRDLSPAELDDFADVVEEAVRVQTAAIEASFEHVLRLAPRPLRGAVRKVLFPGGDRG